MTRADERPELGGASDGPAWLLHGVGLVALAAVVGPAAWALASLVRRASLDGDVLRTAARGALGSIEVCLVAAALGLPLGLAVGSRLAARPTGRLERVAGASLDGLLGIPAIVIGVLAYAIVTLPLGRSAPLAGGAALSMLVFPRVARDAADLLARLPPTVHETAAGLGAQPWRVTWLLFSRTLRRGLLGSTTVALVAAFGAVAPVLFTSVPSREGAWAGALPPLALEAFRAVHAADAAAEGRAAALAVVVALVAAPLGALGRRWAGSPP